MNGSTSLERRSSRFGEWSTRESPEALLKCWVSREFASAWRAKRGLEALEVGLAWKCLHCGLTIRLIQGIVTNAKMKTEMKEKDWK